VSLFDGRGGALSAMASGAAELWLKWFLAGAMASSTNRIKLAEPKARARPPRCRDTKQGVDGR